MSNIVTCSRCPHSQRKCAGPCACTADPERRSILWHAAHADCPLDLLKDGPRPPLAARAVSRDEWPFAACIVAKLATADDKGIGDTVARIIDPARGGAFKLWYYAITGADCGCDDRRERLNVRYPYS